VQRGKKPLYPGKQRPSKKSAWQRRRGHKTWLEETERLREKGPKGTIKERRTKGELTTEETPEILKVHEGGETKRGGERIEKGGGIKKDQA